METARDTASLCRLVEEELRQLYGSRLRGLVLYESYARGEADGGSDVDLLVLLDDAQDFCQEMRETDEVVARLSLEHDIVFSLLPVSEQQFVSSGLPLFRTRAARGFASHDP